MALTPWSFQFGAQTINLTCDEPSLEQTVGQLLRHCQGHTNTVIATYHITTTADDAYALHRETTLLYHGRSASTVIEWLLYDMALTWAQHTRQGLVCHAAGLAWQGQGILLCGASGSGKSTLAGQLVRDGFDYLTDELVLIHPEKKSMVGFSRPIMLKQAAKPLWQQWLSPAASAHLPTLTNGTVLIDPTLLRPGSVQAEAVPRFLFFPRYAPHPSLAYQAWSSAQAAFHLMSLLLNAPHLPDRGFTAVTRLAQKTAAYQLTYGDGAAVSGWIKQVVNP